MTIMIFNFHVISNYRHVVGLIIISQFPQFRYFPVLSDLRIHWLRIEYHIHNCHVIAATLR